MEDLQLLKDSYKVLADIHNQWQGRNTAAGQGLLCRLRDRIAELTDRNPQDVQDNLDA